MTDCRPYILANSNLGKQLNLSKDTAFESIAALEKYVARSIPFVVTLDKQAYSQEQLMQIAQEIKTKAPLAAVQYVTSTSAENVYSKLGYKTQSKNVVLSNIKTSDGKYDRAANLKFSKDNGRVYSMETNSNLSFSNPWASFNRAGTIKTNSTRESVENYIDWLTTDRFKDINPQRREWILGILKEGTLKGKPIQYYADLGEPSHATALDYLINEYNWENNQQLAPQETTSTNTFVENAIANPAEFTNHSGGAIFSDTVWDEIGREFGVTNHKHYREPLSYTDTKGQPAAGSETLDSVRLTRAGVAPTYITQEDYNEGAKKATQAFRTMFQDSGNKNVRQSYIIRNWMQVKNADAIFAIGTIKQPGENASDKKTETRIAAVPLVKGGTGYAVQMAINEGKPVFVFDATKEGWYKYDYAVKNFIPTTTPRLTKNYAGIGSRSLSTQDAINKSIQAIRDVYEATFGKPTANNVQPPSMVTEKLPAAVENTPAAAEIKPTIVEETKEYVEHGTTYKFTLENGVPTSGMFKQGQGEWKPLNSKQGSLQTKYDRLKNMPIPKKELTVTPRMQFKKAVTSKNVVVPPGASESNSVAFEDAENVYLMTDDQQVAYEGIVAKTVETMRNSIKIYNPYSPFVSFESPYLATKYANVAKKEVWDRIIAIQGSAGTGKTTLAKAVVRELKKQLPNVRIAYAAPTHTAATMLQESLGVDSEAVDAGDVYTNASLLGIEENKGVFQMMPFNLYSKRLKKPIVGVNVDVIIMDEVSMVDREFMQSLQERLEGNNEFGPGKIPFIIMMGDMKQLPPIKQDGGRGFAAEAVLANPDKSFKLKQVMRTKDRVLVDLFNIIGDQIERNIAKRLATPEGYAFTPDPYDYSELLKYIEANKGEILKSYNSLGETVKEYAQILFENLSPGSAFYSHYNQLARTETQEVIKAVREAYMTLMYGTTEHLNKKIPFGQVDTFLDKSAGRFSLSADGIADITDLNDVLQLREIESIREFIVGDYVQYPDPFEMVTTITEIERNRLNEFTLATIDKLLTKKGDPGFMQNTAKDTITFDSGFVKPNSRFRVMDIIHDRVSNADLAAQASAFLKRSPLREYVSKVTGDIDAVPVTGGMYMNMEHTLIKETNLLYNRQNRIRANSYFMNTYGKMFYKNDGTDAKGRRINSRYEFMFYEFNTNKVIAKIVIPYKAASQLEDEFHKLLKILGFSEVEYKADKDNKVIISQNRFKKSYVGSSHTVQGAGYEQMFAGLANVLGQKNVDPHTVASSIYTIMTRVKNILHFMNGIKTVTKPTAPIATTAKLSFKTKESYDYNGRVFTIENDKVIDAKSNAEVTGIRANEILVRREDEAGTLRIFKMNNSSSYFYVLSSGKVIDSRFVDFTGDQKVINSIVSNAVNKSNCNGM